MDIREVKRLRWPAAGTAPAVSLQGAFILSAPTRAGEGDLPPGHDAIVDGHHHGLVPSAAHLVREEAVCVRVCERALLIANASNRGRSSQMCQKMEGSHRKEEVSLRSPRTC